MHGPHLHAVYEGASLDEGLARIQSELCVDLAERSLPFSLGTLLAGRGGMLGAAYTLAWGLLCEVPAPLQLTAVKQWAEQGWNAESIVRAARMAGFLFGGGGR